LISVEFTPEIAVTHSLNTGREVTIPTLSERTVSIKAVKLCLSLWTGTLEMMERRSEVKAVALSPWEADDISSEHSCERISGDAITQAK
jgi:hypothetical protein